MTIISPSILSADFNQLGADCRMVLDAGAQMLHYDVMDGHFVPNISFGVPVLKSLHKGMPTAFYDVHLMISHPLQYAEPFIKAGASLYNFHLECEDDIQQTIDAVKALGCKVGLTIKPGTAPEALAPYLDQLDLVLVMSVEPGFGGQKFMPSALEKLRWLKEERAKRSARYLLEVEAGADILVAGSAVFGAADPAAAVRRLAAL
jgi:ribulose-phosphate 3-epimerase